MSNTKWLKPTDIYTFNLMNGLVVMSPEDVTEMALATQNMSLDNLLFGDVTKWLSSLTFYPIKIYQPSTTDKYLLAGGKEYPSVSVRGMLPLSHRYGYYMGYYFYPQATSFLSYEPYHKLRVWFPYYGYADIKIADVQNKYMQFRLYVDYQTGMGQYVVGVSNDFISPPADGYSLEDIDDSEVRIINTFDFKLGVDVPIQSSNFNDKIRDVTLSTLANAVKIGTSIATATIPVSTATEVSKTTYTKRNPTTGRQITARTTKSETTTQRYENNVRGRINTAVDTAQTVIGGLNLQPTVQTSSNSSLNYGLCNSIVITDYSVEPTVDIFNDDDYKHLNGLPLGEIRTLKYLQGFTTFSNVDMRTTLQQATERNLTLPTFSEIDEIEQLLMNGVYMVSEYNVSFNLTNVVDTNMELPHSISIIDAENNISLFFALRPLDGYVMPEDITATNAEIYKYNPITGEIIINHISGDVTITIEATNDVTPITGDLIVRTPLNELFEYIDELNLVFTSSSNGLITVATDDSGHYKDLIEFDRITSENNTVTDLTKNSINFGYSNDYKLRTHYLDGDDAPSTEGRYIGFNNNAITIDLSFDIEFRKFTLPNYNLFQPDTYTGTVHSVSTTTIFNIGVNELYHILRLIGTNRVPRPPRP